MGDKHFTTMEGARAYTGPSEPPTDEEWDAYLASAPDEKTWHEWAKHRPAPKDAS